MFDALRPGMRDVFGPVMRFPDRRDETGPVVIPGIFAPGTVVPLHGHDDRETLFVAEGQIEVCLDGVWTQHVPGDIVEIAPGLRHAIRNASDGDAALLLVATVRMAAFLEEVSAPASEAQVTPGRLGHLARTAAAYGYWTGDMSEQAAIGLHPGRP